MSVDALMADLATLGIRLEAKGDRLRFHPRSAVTPNLAERMQAHKSELLAILRGDSEAMDRSKADELWQVLLDRLDGNALFPPDVVGALKAAQVQWIHEPAESTQWKCRCGSAKHRDVPIHGGRSVRRDCARCERFIEFVKWYDQNLIDC